MRKKNLFKPLFFITGVVLIISLGTIFLSFSDENEKDKDKIFQHEFQRDYAIYSVHIPDSIYFAGEKIPVEYADVYESLDKELLINTYWQSSTLLFLKRANKYFPIIEPILKKNGVPDDFKYIALIESGLTNVVSPAGASGYWQFMKSTGSDYGLEINSEVDERYNIEKSTDAACQYFLRAYKKYNDWILAAASYNVGMGAIDAQLNRQNADNYFDLVLNSETARYVYRMVAVKMILSDPESFGFHCRKKDMYYNLEYDTVHVDSTVNNFVEFAKNYNITYKELKFLNPWLRDVSLKNAQKKDYVIKIPKHRTRRLPDFVLENKKITSDSIIH